jgi:hypothetical protein
MRPESKKVVVVDARTGAEIRNVLLLDFSSETGVIAFQPETVPGTYYVYYLPYHFRAGWHETRRERVNDYLEPAYDVDAGWKENVLAHRRDIARGKVERFETRSRFDFFTSMGVIATGAETDALKTASKGDYLIFPEDRAFPIRLPGVPARWATRGASASFEGYARPNEYYTWQLGIWAAHKPLKNVRLRFSDFVNGGDTIRSAGVTCFNGEGVNWDGAPVRFRIDVDENRVQALWCGMQIPEHVTGGDYAGRVTVLADGLPEETVDVKIRVGGDLLPDKGDGDLWRHARLRWLNSTIGADNVPVPPYQKIEPDNRRITATGKSVLLDGSGLPQSIEINGCRVIEKPVAFTVYTSEGPVVFTADNLEILPEAGGGLVRWKSSSQQSGLHFGCEAYMDYSGYLRYHVRLSSDAPVEVKDIRLETVYTPGSSTYFMGTGFKGGFRPAEYVWDWNGPYDSYWMGDSRSGLHVEFRGGAYHGPLLNDYKPAPPAVWTNGGKGRILLNTLDRSARVVASTGACRLTGNPLDFEFGLLITPVKPLNTGKHFSERYYHSEEGFDKAAGVGANINNLHHSTSLNPVINYPYIVRDSLIAEVRRQHEADRKIKLYYTIRELTNYTTEIFALKSLNHEIFVSGPGYGLPWHCEHLIDDYRSAWYTELPGQNADAALMLSGFSRWINYYLEGLRWMFENYKIDGIYMDDVSFDGEVMKRVRRIMDQYRPGALIDLHSNTSYSKGPANQYARFFPYVDRLWFGEGFEYDEMGPDEWLVTFSGIPFGMMSEMLQEGGNPYLGMVYGATARHGYWDVDNEPVWKLWKAFGIEEAEMAGYWDAACLVKTNHPEVKATAYIRSGEVLVSIGNFAAGDRTVRLSFDWDRLGIDPSRAVLYAPEVERFQKERTFGPGEDIPVGGKQGWLLILRPAEAGLTSPR